MTVDEVRAQFPGWDIRPVFGGYAAVPKGSSLVVAMYLDSLVEKIREQEKS